MNTIVLIDDNGDDNFFHERIIKKADVNCEVVIYSSADNALPDIVDLKIKPSIIFLDINMPRMNGWEFLDEIHASNVFSESPFSIYMLSTSDNPDDIEKSKTYEYVRGFFTKPLSVSDVQEVNRKLS